MITSRSVDAMQNRFRACRRPRMFDNQARDRRDTPVRFPYTLDRACACFLVECTRANSITRAENGEESFETLGFEKNFVHTINNMTQRRNTFR